MKKTKTRAVRHQKIKQGIALVLPVTLIGGWFYPPLGLFLFVCMLGAIGIGVIKGRYWCDWMCPRGSFLDVYLKRFSLSREIPGIFRSIYFRLGILGLLIGVLLTRLVPIWGDWYEMGRPMVQLLTITTSAAIIMGLFYNPRVWCMVCPMGTLSSLLGRGKQELQVSDNCVDCGLCSKVCRMQIKPAAYREQGTVRDGDCLKCSYCVDVCPRRALSFERSGRNAA